MTSSSMVCTCLTQHTSAKTPLRSYIYLDGRVSQLACHTVTRLVKLNERSRSRSRELDIHCSMPPQTKQRTLMSVSHCSRHVEVDASRDIIQCQPESSGWLTTTTKLSRRPTAANGSRSVLSEHASIQCRFTCKLAH